MDPTLRMLMSQSSIFGNPYQPQMPMFNLGNMIPGMNNQQGTMMSMMMQPFLQGFLQNQGLAGMQFMGTQNIYDTMQATQMMQERQLAMVQATQADRAQMERMMKGATHLVGGQWNQEAGDRLMKVGMPMFSMMAQMMPDLADQMMGSRGSATVMSQGIFAGGRYAIDPVSGMHGYSPDTTAHITRRVYEDMYGDDDAVRRMRGVRAGELGRFYDESQRRGFIGSMGEDTKKGILDSAIGPGMDTAGMLREGEVSRMKGYFENMTGVIAAMKDIFGDAGHPNAPVPALINALQALTQGGMTATDPTVMKNNLRSMQMLGRMNAMDLGGIMQLSGQGAMLSDQFGISRQFGEQATLHAMAFAAAARQAPPKAGYGVLDLQSLMSMDQQLTVSAAKSPLANQYNAIMGLWTEYGGHDKFHGTEFGAMASAIAAGQSQYSFGGKTFETAMDWQSVHEMATKAGISGSSAMAFLQSPEAIRRYGLKYNTALLARDSQRNTDINRILEFGVSTALADQGIGVDTTDIAQAISKGFWSKDLLGVDRDAWADTIVNNLDPKYRNGNQGYNEAKVKAAVRDGLIRSEQYAAEHGQTLEAWVQLHHPERQKMARAMASVASNRGKLADALSGLGQGGLMRNIVDALAMSKPGTSASAMLTTALGGVTNQELRKQLEVNFAGADEDWKVYNDDNTPEDEKQRRLEALQKKFGQMQNALEKASPEAQKQIRAAMAGDDDMLLANMKKAMPGLKEDQMRAALKAASPEQRERMLATAQAMAGAKDTSQPADVLKKRQAELDANPEIAAYREFDKTGNMKEFLRKTVGEKGLDAAGLGATEVSLKPGSKIDISGELTIKDGKGKVEGAGQSGGRNSVPTPPGGESRRS